MRVLRASPLPVAVFLMCLLMLETKPSLALEDRDAAQPSLRLTEMTRSPLVGDMTAVEFEMSLSRTSTLRAIEVRVQPPASSGAHLEISPQSPSPDVSIFPVKTMAGDGSRLFAL